MTVFSRRAAVVSILSTPLFSACGFEVNQPSSEVLEQSFRDIENRSGGRIGVAALDLSNGTTASFRAGERFLMCSTFKWILGALILGRVDSGHESLSREIPILTDDIVFHAPTTSASIGDTLSVGQLCSATITNSDNPAANLLLRTLGGPVGFTAKLREMGDMTTRLDRWEPDLNASEPSNTQDTTTPAAMLRLMRQLVFGEFLSPKSRAILQDWMLGTVNGSDRLAAGLPPNWRLGHKPGTNNRNANNDVGFALSLTDRRRKPVLIASFSDVPGALMTKAASRHADIASAIIASFLADSS